MRVSCPTSGVEMCSQHFGRSAKLPELAYKASPGVTSMGGGSNAFQSMCTDSFFITVWIYCTLNTPSLCSILYLGYTFKIYNQKTSCFLLIED